jgi:ectoine hydroxylase-related dioxygenase (phytanoyl-CoA dioxygenase family)
VATRVGKAEAEAYKRDGYLVIKGPVFPKPMFDKLVAYAEEKYAEHAAAAGGKAPSLIDCPHWSDPRVFEWLLAPEMLSIVEPLIGPDIGIFACHLLQKPASVGKRVPWHEDSAYWKGALEPMTVASITVSLLPSTKQNGCLSVIAGSHVNGYSSYEKVEKPSDQIFDTEIKPEEVDESRMVDVELAPNDASLHDGKLIHGSAPNTGTMARSAFTVRYFPTNVKFVPDSNEHFRKGFQIYLARGRDKAGNTWSDPKRVYKAAGVIA